MCTSKCSCFFKLNPIETSDKNKDYRFTTYQDARRVRLVDGLIFETNILRVSPVKNKEPSACTAFSDPCGPLLLVSLYNIEHL